MYTRRVDSHCPTGFLTQVLFIHESQNGEMVYELVER